MFSTQLSDWRTTQFRQALRTFALPSSDADVDRLHEFDRAIRFELLDRIERIELALRGRMSTVAGAEFGPMWQLDPRAYRSGVDPGQLGGHFGRALERSFDPAARQVLARRGLDHVTFGMLSEHLSLGAISRLSGLVHPRIARELARVFGLPAPTLRATLQHVTHVRNCCAHHTRIWGTRFGVPTPDYRSPAALAELVRTARPRTPYRSLLLVSHMADSVHGESARAEALTRLLDGHRDLLVGLGADHRPDHAASSTLVSERDGWRVTAGNGGPATDR